MFCLSSLLSAILLVLTVVLHIPIINTKKSSGLYIENAEFQQSFKLRNIDNHELENLSDSLRNLLDLPRHQIRHNTSNIMHRKIVPVNFLSQLFDSQAKGLSGEQRHKRKVDFSDNYFTTGDVLKTVTAQGSIKCPQLENIFWFNVSKLNQAEIMEVHLVVKAKHNHFHSVQLYRVDHCDNNNNISATIISTHSHALDNNWVIFNVTDLLSEWILDLSTNNGITISYAPHQNASGVEPRTNNSFKVPEKDWPFILIEAKAPPLTIRQEKQAEKRRVRRKAPSDTQKVDGTTKRPTYRRIMGDKFGILQLLDNRCQRRTFYVSFAELKWDTWIIAPSGFEAGFCNGECNFPMNLKINTTNHAIVQTLMHVKQPKRIPKTCCAPQSLQSISVLYFNEEGEAILRKYKDMIVSSCGCL